MDHYQTFFIHDIHTAVHVHVGHALARESFIAAGMNSTKIASSGRSRSRLLELHKYYVSNIIMGDCYHFPLTSECNRMGRIQEQYAVSP